MNAAIPESTLAESATAAKWQIARRVVASLSELPENWDGEGGKPALAGTIAGAKRLLASLEQSAPDDPPALVTLTNEGVVFMEWGNEPRRHYEVLDEVTAEYFEFRGIGNSILETRKIGA